MSLTHTLPHGRRTRAVSEADSALGRSAEDGKRGEIRKAAYRCFLRTGYHDTTVDAICSSLGISKGSFYWYFQGKQQAFLSILDAWARTVEDEMSGQFRNALAGADRFASLHQALVNEARRSRSVVRVWLEFLTQVGRVPEIRSGLLQFHERIGTVIAGLLLPILPDNMSATDQKAMATMVLACFLGLICLELVDPESADVAETLDRFLAFLKTFIERGGNSHAPAVV